MKRKWIRYILAGAAACVLIWALLLAAALVYVKVNKETIIASVQSDLTKKISGKISFDDLAIDPFHNFPGVTIGLRNVHLQDSSFDVHKKELLAVQHIYMGFGILDLLTGKKQPKYITLTNGTIFLFSDSAGNKNWNILKAQNPELKKIELKKVTLRNMNLFFEDDRKYKFYNLSFEKLKCIITEKNNRLTCKTDCAGIIKNSSFNTKRGSYMTNKKLVGEWQIIYDRVLKKVSLRNQLVRLDRQGYRLTGDFFLTAIPALTLTSKPQIFL